MSNKQTSDRASAAIDDVLEQYGILRIWHKTALAAAIVMLCCMIGLVVWGILFEPLRGILIAFGVVMGVCGAALYLAMHKVFFKTSAAILDCFRASGMTELEILQKARDYKITIPKNAGITDDR